MGYTHYWRNATDLAPEIFSEFTACCKRICEEVENKGVKLANYEGVERPEVSPDEVAFNGAEPLDHEPFIVNLSNDPFEFCKTAHKPYDLAVTACLVALKHFFPAVDVSSDGDLEDWQPAIDLCEALFGWGKDFTL